MTTTWPTSMDDGTDPAALERRWRAVLEAGSGLYNLADSRHPLRIYIGGNSTLAPTLTLVLSERPQASPTFNLLTIETRRREDGTWLLMLQLESSKAFREFVTMCSDLILASRRGSNESEALLMFWDSLDQWRNLLKPVANGLLGDAQLRGLVAELSCMTELLRPSRSWSEIMLAWVGPLAAPQDFKLSDGILIEAKAVHRDSSRVRISSLAQLDPGQGQLFLATVEVERVVAGFRGSSTVPALVRSIEAELRGSFGLADQLREKLDEIEFDIDAAGYDDYWYVPGPIKVFGVGPGFPRLTRSDVPSGLVGAEYEIALETIQQFTVDPIAAFLELQ